jgi:hypothetical protein
MPHTDHRFASACRIVPEVDEIPYRRRIRNEAPLDFHGLRISKRDEATMKRLESLLVMAVNYLKPTRFLGSPQTV